MEKSLAIIIPVYRSTASVAELIDKIAEIFSGVCPYHIFLVDDGNEGEVRDYLVTNCLQEHVTLFSFDKNYG